MGGLHSYLARSKKTDRHMDGRTDGRTDMQSYFIRPVNNIHVRQQRESKTCMCGTATCDLGHIMTNCRHFGERLNRGDLAKLEGRAG